MSIEDLQPSFFDLARADEVDQQSDQSQGMERSVNDNEKLKATKKKVKGAQECKVVQSLAEQTRDLQAIHLLSTAIGISIEEAEEILVKVGGFHRLARMPEYALQTLPHIGERKAAQIRSMTEWALLLSKYDNLDRIQMRCPADVANLLMLEMSMLEREELRVVGLDTKHNVLFEETIYKGSLNSAVVRVSEIFRRPVTQNCASIVLVHNHPSGDPTPSPEDVKVTNLIRETGEKLDIDVIDHLVIGGNRFVSLKERGLGFP